MCSAFASIELLLISKSMLDRIKAQAPPTPERHSIAMNVLPAHDAAELALSGIANQCGQLPPGKQHFLMDYFASLKTLHSKNEVPGNALF